MNPPFRTHYDNLKVSIDAPPEVIKAAYKALSLKLHPDRNPNDPEAARRMAIVNRSYAVLSDPELRARHDLWIRRMIKSGEAPPVATPESDERAEDVAAESAERTTDTRPPDTKPPDENRGSGAHRPRFENFYTSIEARVIIAIFGLSVMAVGVDFLGRQHLEPSRAQSIPPPSDPPRPSEYRPQASPGAFESWLRAHPESPGVRLPSLGYVRPVTAPNGSTWPTVAGYVDGFPVDNTGGLSLVSIDNSKNSSDVYVKLSELTDGGAHNPVRHGFIPKGGTLQMDDIAPGRYDVRYRNLDSGQLSRSEPFTLQEIKTETGTRYSHVQMTLYTVPNGNMKTYRISEAEF